MSMKSDSVLDTLPGFAALTLSVTETVDLPSNTIISAPTKSGAHYLLSTLCDAIAHPISITTTSDRSITLKTSSPWTWSETLPLCCYIYADNLHTTLVYLEQLLSSTLQLSYQEESHPLHVRFHQVNQPNQSPGLLLTGMINQPRRYCYIDIYPSSSLHITDNCILTFTQIAPELLQHLTINAAPAENRCIRPSEPIHIKRSQHEYIQTPHHPLESSCFVPLSQDLKVYLSPQEALCSHGKTCTTHIPCYQNIPNIFINHNSFAFYDKEYTSVQCISLINKISRPIHAPQSTHLIKDRYAITQWNYLGYKRANDWMSAWNALLKLHQRQHIDIIDHWIENMTNVTISPTDENTIRLTLSLSQPTPFDRLAKHICQMYFNDYRPLNLQVIFDYAV